MMSGELSTAPILSTPDIHVLDDNLSNPEGPALSDGEIFEVYEIGRTVQEIRAGGWRRIALQFPDSLLKNAPRVFRSLQERLSQVNDGEDPNYKCKLYILADTSYGSCCVDEIAAEHVDADVVVHYGRSCLSPTTRLPVIYIFTSQPLDLGPVISSFKDLFSKDDKVILMADIVYSAHIPALMDQLKGYSVFAPEIIHDPSSPLPNRTVPPSVATVPDSLREYALFYVAPPPTSLQLTLASRVRAMYIHADGATTLARTSPLLRRRYGAVAALASCAVFGILVNTLSVRSYMRAVDAVRRRIAAAGKKSYTVVVGKVNAAKVANFAEVGGWVVVGCWESSLVDADGFYRPLITPFELALALVPDEKRVWSGDWTGDLTAGFVDGDAKTGEKAEVGGLVEGDKVDKSGGDVNDDGGGDCGDHDEDDEEEEEESEPPEFDLRMGRYVSRSRPMRSTAPSVNNGGEDSSNSAGSTTTLARRAKGDIATINGVVSPAAEYLRSQRTWTGLGSDFDETQGFDEGAIIEQGRSGIARRYEDNNQ